MSVILRKILWIYRYKIMNKEEHMNIRNITPEDLPAIKGLLAVSIDDKQLSELSFKESSACVDDNNLIIAAVLLKNSPLADFFGGRIPDDNNYVKYRNHVAEDSEYFTGEQHEVIAWVPDDKEILDKMYREHLNHHPISLWRKYAAEESFPFPHFCNLNISLLVDMPYLD